MGREYPLGYKYYRERCHKAFDKNRTETDPQKIEEMIKRGEYVIKEIEALYRLKKYRFLKKSYYKDENEPQV